MAKYLSEEWLELASVALSSDRALAEAAKGTETVIQYEVTGTPHGKVTYGVCFRDGAASIEPGGHTEATASFSADYETAVEVAKGELSAQAAFMQGRMKLGGDVGVLIRQHSLIDGLSDALGTLRDSTEY